MTKERVKSKVGGKILRKTREVREKMAAEMLKVKGKSTAGEASTVKAGGVHEALAAGKRRWAALRRNTTWPEVHGRTPEPQQ